MKKIAVLLFAVIMMLALTTFGSGGQPAADAGAAADKTASADVDGETAVKAEKTAFNEITAMDNDSCTIRITDTEPQSEDGAYTLKVHLENKSADTSYSFSLGGISVNNVQKKPEFYADVGAGESAEEEIKLYYDDMPFTTPEDITDIELTFRAYETDNWTSETEVKETVHIYPYGEDKAETFVREAEAADNVLVDNDDLSVIVTGYDENGFWGYTVNLYLVNKTDKTIAVNADNVTVNGVSLNPYWSEALGAGKSAFSEMFWTPSDLEDNGIDTVEEIELRLTAYDPEDWTADDILNQTVMLKP